MKQIRSRNRAITHFHQHFHQIWINTIIKTNIGQTQASKFQNQILKTSPVFRTTCTYKWSCLLKAFEHLLHVYLRSSLCVSLCLASALELLNSLLQMGHRMIDRGPPWPSTEDLSGRDACRSPLFLDSLPEWHLEPRPKDRGLYISDLAWPMSTSSMDISPADTTNWYQPLHNRGLRKN